MKARGFFFALVLTVLSAASVSATPVIDGIASIDEYDAYTVHADGGVVLYWTFTDEALYAAAEVKTTGWVSVGFDPEDVMEGADMVIGWVEPDGTAHVLDCYSTGPYGPHPPDTELGGKDHLISRAAVEENGITTIEFSRPLKAGDEFDKDVAPGVTVIWAYADYDNFDEYHSAAGYAEFFGPDIDLEESSDRIAALSRAARNRIFGLILPHAVPLALSFLGMITGILIARFRKKNKNWLKIHRPIGYVSASLAVIGLAMGVRLVSVTSGVHFRVFHAFLGAFTLLLVFAAPILGRGLTKWKAGRTPGMKMTHRIVGRLAVLCMAATIVFGLLEIF